MNEEEDCLTTLSSEILLIHVPGISHRGKSVRDVESIRRWNNTFGHAMAAAQDEVVSLQVETLHRHWKEGEVSPVTLL